MPETHTVLLQGLENAKVAQTRRVVVCAGTGCIANGSMKVFEKLKAEIAAAGLNVVLELRPEAAVSDMRVSKSGCQGFCQMGPLVTMLPEEILYKKVKVEDVAEIVSQTLVGGKVVDRLLYVDPATKKHCRGINDIPFYQRQQRFVLKECGTIDPENIQEYMHHGGYAAAKKAFLQMTPEQIVQEITKSGLRGRGGGGFPTGRKWEAARGAEEREEICDLQRRRGRSRRVHEPQRDGRQSAQRARRPDDRRARHRRR